MYDRVLAPWEDVLLDEDWEQLAEEREKGVPENLSWFYDMIYGEEI